MSRVSLRKDAAKALKEALPPKWRVFDNPLAQATPAEGARPVALAYCDGETANADLQLNLNSGVGAVEVDLMVRVGSDNADTIDEVIGVVIEAVLSSGTNLNFVSYEQTLSENSIISGEFRFTALIERQILSTN